MENPYSLKEQAECYTAFEQGKRYERNKTNEYKNKLVEDTISLNYLISDCLSKLIDARLNKDHKKESEAVFNMETLMVQTMQHLDCVANYLEKQ